MTGKHLLDEIERGLDGVTAGEWADQWDGDGGAFISGAGSVIADMVGPRAKRKKNAEHIARCSPDAMREIAAYVRELEAERDHYAKGEMAAVEKGHEHFHRATAAEATVTALQEALAKAAEALEDILAPIAKAQRELEPGQRLSGMAYSILTSAENLREIARAALHTIRRTK